MGIQALAAYASKVYAKDVSISVAVKAGDQKESLNIDPTNAIILQSVLVSFFINFTNRISNVFRFQLKDVNQSIDIEASGKGIGYVQVNYHYNMPKRDDPKPFACDLNIIQRWEGELTASLCCQ